MVQVVPMMVQCVLEAMVITPKRWQDDGRYFLNSWTPQVLRIL